ncbi:hypothetical protein RYX36_001240, partial [Vicia faba]
IFFRRSRSENDGWWLEPVVFDWLQTMFYGGQLKVCAVVVICTEVREDLEVARSWPRGVGLR